ncbi:serine hydrolase domain-containing protein [Polaribacter porphyrae]|uniref:Beta-lactamase-related domain-containing protein n=1 Tax=Polaribacter porphyrae TaxID=1137780 RepID=A0A2S7WNU0_9FLAO|nr:serine hydrolase domain-containing protein [Polaribacter porphyrae]PQJ79269.1 hypothetical protein BTO18_08830 [Polaribacter porphyrae]
MKHYIIVILLLFSIFSDAQTLSNKQLKDSIKAIIHKQQIPGGVVTVVTKDSVLFKTAFGHSDLNRKEKVTDENLFKIASISKTFTAIAIMQLVEKGKLKLDDNLSSVVPEVPFKNKWSNSHPVKIKHLLEHKSGFSDFSYSHLTKRYESEKAKNIFDQVLALQSALKTNFKPGLVTTYSNPGYIVLAYIIEKISRKTYEDYIKENILNPLEITNTGFKNDFGTSVKSLLTKGYFLNQGKLILSNKEIENFQLGASGLISDVNDMSKFLQFFLNQKSQNSTAILSKDGILNMEKLHSDFDKKNKIKTGYNLALEDRIFGDKEFLFYGNSGLTDGFVSNFIYSRDLDIGVFVSTNLFMRSNEQIINLLINNFCKQKSINYSYNTNTRDLSEFEDWEGEHRELNDSQEIWNFINFPVRTKTVKIEDNFLIISDIEDGEYRYKNVGGNAFLNEDLEEKIPTVYLTDFDGKKSIYYYDSTYIPTNKISYSILRTLLIFSIVLLLLTIIVLIINVIRFIFVKKTKNTVLQLLRLSLPFICILLSVLFAINNLSFNKIDNLGTITITSVSIFMLTVLFPILCIWMIYKERKRIKFEKRKFYKLFCLLAVFANIFICTYCVSMGWFAVMFWS